MKYATAKGGISLKRTKANQAPNSVICWTKILPTGRREAVLEMALKSVLKESSPAAR